MHWEPAWRYSVDRSGELTTVALSGDIDLTVHEQVRAVLLEELGASDVGVVADVSGIGFIDSTTLSTFIVAFKAANAGGKRFSLRDPDPRLTRILRIAGLAEVLLPR